MEVPQGRQEPSPDQPIDRPRVHLRRGCDSVPRPHRYAVADDPHRGRRSDGVPLQAPHPDPRRSLRRLTPRELERLNGFPGDWTLGMSDGKRAFMMGNALVVGLVERVARVLSDDIEDPSPCTERAASSSWRDSSSHPPPTSPAVRNVMRANRARNTRPERRLRRALREAGLGGYRLNWRKAPGRPDIAYPGRRLAIFVHGCYWHHCERCYPNPPKSNTAFWERKFELNRERDGRKRESLERVGWSVIEAWECDLRDRLDVVTSEIRTVIIKQ